MNSEAASHLMELQLAFGENLRQWREQHDLTQEAAAARTGISATTYQKIENGHRMPRLENVVKLLRGLAIPPEVLFAGLAELLPEPESWAPAGRLRQLPARRRAR